MERLTLERDGYTWCVIDGSGLERVADTNTASKPLAEKIKKALETGELPAGWRYEPPTEGPGMRWGKLYAPTLKVDVWLPRLTALHREIAV